MAKRKTNTPSTSTTKKKRPPWKKRNAKRAEDTLTWLTRLNEELTRSGMDTEDVVSSTVYMTTVKEAIGGLPDDWKPVSKSNGKLDVGNPVQLKNDAEKSYSFIRDFEKRMKGAVIASVFDKQSVIVQLSDGEKTLIQKRHLERAPS